MHFHFNKHGCGPRGRHSAGRGFGAEFGPDGVRFGFGPGGRGRGGRGGDWGGGRRGRMFGSGELRLVLLKLIADEPRHGYDLIRAIEERTGGQYAPSPGVVYPTLTMLQDMGLIEERASEGARKAFAATDEGRTHLEQNSEEVETLFARLDEAAPKHSEQSAAALGRASANLMAAIRNRVSQHGIDENLVHEISAILDEAAQRIERLK